MAGYDWQQGKSNNAVAAEETAAFVRFLIDERVIPYEEWHHTSKMYNRTYYFSAETIREELAVHAAAPAGMGGSLEWWRARYRAARGQ